MLYCYQVQILSSKNLMSDLDIFFYAFICRSRAVGMAYMKNKKFKRIDNSIFFNENNDIISTTTISFNQKDTLSL